VLVGEINQQGESLALGFASDQSQALIQATLNDVGLIGRECTGLSEGVGCAFEVVGLQSNLPGFDGRIGTRIALESSLASAGAQNEGKKQE